jgi:hypothetical protein
MNLLPILFRLTLPVPRPDPAGRIRQDALPRPPQTRDQLRQQRVRHLDMNLGRAAPANHHNAALLRAAHIFDGVQVHEPAGRTLLEEFTLDRQRLPCLPLAGNPPIGQALTFHTLRRLNRARGRAANQATDRVTQTVLTLLSRKIFLGPNP